MIVIFKLDNKVIRNFVQRYLQERLQIFEKNQLKKLEK